MLYPEAEKITVIGFDRDGTLIDNMDVKADAFARATLEFYHLPKELADDIKSLYLETRGIPRFDQLEIVRKKYCLPKLTKRETEAWSKRFEELYISEGSEVFPDVRPVLTGLQMRGYGLFMSTSAPQESIEKIERKAKLGGFFERMLGTRSGFGRKEHLEHICRRYNVRPENMAFVGDGPEDVKVTKKYGALAIGLNRDGKGIEKADIVISNLVELLDIFRHPKL